MQVKQQIANCTKRPVPLVGLREAGPGRDGGGENAVEYFRKQGRISSHDALEIIWYHAANRKAQMEEALKSGAHMIEADILIGSHGSHRGEPIMAHPPETDSDNTLYNWLSEVRQSDKGIKLDFKSLSTVEPAMKMLVSMKDLLTRPVWINADILPGPNESKDFLCIVTSYLPHVTLSLGWKTDELVNQTSLVYTWEMVKEMEQICQPLSQPVTFPVRAALVRPSWPQLSWLLEQSERNLLCGNWLPLFFRNNNSLAVKYFVEYLQVVQGIQQYLEGFRVFRIY
ncbi:protein FAM151B isoform X3 [Stegostoma tigrinum]|uniref:protein FAM151B isoform X3 n=1 Tax=Stegostoma tigrinum TaxID=3053191 RepID=UPI00202B799D|nr:protein FAM151B isoform X3 [Stegostoma tigrinum]